MSKKIQIIASVLLIAVFALSACAPAQTATPAAEPTKAETQPTSAPAVEPTKPAAEEPKPTEAAPAEPKSSQPGNDVDWENVDPTGQEVIFWHQHTKERETGLLELVDAFNKSNEWGITVKAEYQGGYGDIFNKMLPILNTPDAPSLVVAYQNQAATYQLVKGLVDMTPMVNSAKWGIAEADQKDFFPGFGAQEGLPNFENARLGLAPNRSMEVLYYNIEWLKELGYDAPPATPEQFKEMACKAAKTPFSKATAEGSIGYELSIDTSRLASFTFAFGGDIFDYQTGMFTLNSEAAVNAATFLQDLINNGCATQVTEAYGDQTDFGAGKTLFTVGSTSGLPFYQKAIDEGAKFEWSVGAVPHTTPDPVMNVYGASVSIPVTSPEEELAAFLFLKYYTSPEIQAKWAEISNYFPVRASVADSMKDYFDKNPTYKTSFEMLKYGHFEPPVPGYDFVRNEVETTLAAIVDGGDPKALLDALNEKANVELEAQLSQIK